MAQYFYLFLNMKTKEEFQRELGSNLRKLRTMRNWSIEKLALESGLTYSQVGRLELGRRNPTAYTIYILSNTLQIKPADIFEGKDL